MRRVLTLAMKDVRLILRDHSALFFTLAFPVLFAAFFGTVFAPSENPPGISVAIVDEDGTARSRELVSKLTSAPELRAITTFGEPPAAITKEQAANLVRLGRRTAFVLIPKGYGDEDRSLFLGATTTLELGIDPSRSAETGLLEGVVTRYAFEQFGSVMRDPQATRKEVARARQSLRTSGDEVDPVRRGLFEAMLGGVDGLMANLESQPAEAGADVTDAAGAFAPVQINVRDVARQTAGPKNAYTLTFAQGIMWAVAACSAAFGVSLVVERSRGTLVRLRVAPLSWLHVLAGKALACFLATAVVCAALLLLARVVFNVQPVSPVKLAVAVLCVCWCFVGLMMLLSVVGRSESSAGSIAWAGIILAMMLGGGTVPLFFMPGWLQTLSYASPVRWGILALEGGLWRDLSWSEMALPCAVLLGLGALGLALGVRLFRWSER
jgi:ABC-2 type transport system permease protein